MSKLKGFMGFIDGYNDRMREHNKSSLLYGELPEFIANMIDGHEWDNKNISEQRDWAISKLSTALESVLKAEAAREEVQRQLDSCQQKLREIAELHTTTSSWAGHYDLGVAKGHKDAVDIASAADLGQDWRGMCDEARGVIKKEMCEECFDACPSKSSCGLSRWLKSHDEAAK